MKGQSGMIDLKLFRGYCFMTDICDCRVAFSTENLFAQFCIIYWTLMSFLPSILSSLTGGCPNSLCEIVHGAAKSNTVGNGGKNIFSKHS